MVLPVIPPNAEVVVNPTSSSVSRRYTGESPGTLQPKPSAVSTTMETRLRSGVYAPS